jgi:phosphatidylglycerophosphate synthase
MTVSLPVALYVPNLLGYARIHLAFVGLSYAQQQRAALAITIWIFSAFLDLFDGMLARKLNQCSKFGILIDIAADNILRTITWVACILVAHDKPLIVSLSAAVICLEWFTMLATQLHSKEGGGLHWKAARSKDPAIIQYYFSNGFKNPLGIVGVSGLFIAPVCLFLSHAPNTIIGKKSPLLFAAVKYICYSGRTVTALIELYFIITYLKVVIENDVAEKREKENAVPSYIAEATPVSVVSGPSP